MLKDRVYRNCHVETDIRRLWREDSEVAAKA